MRKCKNLVSGEVCDYFVYCDMLTNIPSWYKKIGSNLKTGNHLVRDKYELIYVFDDYEKFSEQYEIVHPITEGECVESPPATEDILEKGRGHVEAFNNRMDELNGLGICKNKRTGTLHTFKLYDKPVDGITVISDDGEFDYFTRYFNQMFDVVKSPGVESPPAHNSLEGPRFCRLIDSNLLHEYFVL